MIAGMSTSSLFGRDLLENNIDHMAKMGVKTIEVYLNTFSEFRPEYARELRKRIDDHGMTVHSVHPHGTVYELQFYAKYSRSQDDAEYIFRQVQESAAILGAGLTVYHGGFPIKNPNHRPYLPAVARTLTKCAEIAKEYNLKFAHENVHWAWFSFPQYADDLLDIVESDNLYFTLDIKQAAQSGYSYRDYLKHMAGRVVNVHCCDYRIVEGHVKTFIPRKGEFDFAQLKQDLKAAGYDGPTMLELYPSDYADLSELKESFRQFREVMDDTV